MKTKPKPLVNLDRVRHGTSERPWRAAEGVEMKTGQALLHCARWLKYCIDIGWSKADLPRLEVLWWKCHDDRGRLKDVWD
jgi:hypothetical protein